MPLYGVMEKKEASHVGKNDLRWVFYCGQLHFHWWLFAETIVDKSYAEVLQNFDLFLYTYNSFYKIF